MIEGATKRTWVQGGVGVAADARAAGAASAARGDGFGDSIASALERLLAGANASRPMKVGADPSLGRLVVDDVREDEPLSDATAADLASFELAASDLGPSADLAAWASAESPSPGLASSGLASSGLASSGLTSSGLTSSGLTSSGLTSSGLGSSRLASSGLASSGLASSGLASSGLASSGLASSGWASSPGSSLEDLSPAPVDPGGMAVWEGTPWDGEPMDGAHSPFSERPTTTATGQDSRELPTLFPDPHADVDDTPVPLVTKRAPKDVELIRACPTDLEELAPRNESSGGRIARVTQHGHAEPKDARRVEGRGREIEGSDGERSEGRRLAPSARSRGAGRDERDGPATRVHTLPVVSVGDRDAARTVAVQSPKPTLEIWREPPANDASSPRDQHPEATPYHVARLGDHRARVELMHPELGRVEVEVTTAESRVDVELLARSLGASIALRSSEEELRGELRQRGASLRNYRVRTATAAGVAARADEEEWR